MKTLAPLAITHRWSRAVVAVLVVSAAIAVGCRGDAEPAPSGVSTATPTVASPTAIETPRPTSTSTPSATMTPTQLEAVLTKALLQRGDVPGSNWVVQDVGMKDLAEAIRTAASQGNAQLAPDFQAICAPGQSAATKPTTAVDGVMRVFDLPPDGAVSVVSLAMRTADAQQQVASGRATRLESIRDCLEREIQRSVAAQLPGARVSLMLAESVPGLPDNANGSDLVARISRDGMAVIQRVGTLAVAQGDILAITTVTTATQGSTAAPVPAPLKDLAATSAKRLAEAVR